MTASNITSGGAADAAATVLDRPRLTSRILALPPSEVMIINAARGYGVTTALKQAVGVSGDLVYWVSADEHLGDEHCRQRLSEAVGAGPAQGIDGVLERLEEGPPAWLIVDSVAMSAQPGFARDLMYVADHLPAHLRMVIASSQWFGPLPRAQRLTDLELAFTEDEALALLMSRQPHVDIDLANEIVSLCEGWADALVASADSPPDAVAWLRGPGAVVLFEQWFDQLTQAQRDLLVHTRVLRTLCAENVVAVTGRRDAGDTLHELTAERAHLFEVAGTGSDDRRWWRRHLLLSAFLDHIDESDAMAAHSRAADWYMGTDDIDSVMHHLLAAGRFDDAGRYLTDHESVIFSRGGGADQLLTWYDRMAPSADDHFLHLLRIGWGQILGRDIPAADATVTRLSRELADQRQVVDLRYERDQTLSADPQQPGSLRSAQVAEAALLRSYLASFHADPATMIANARRLAIEPTDHLNPESVQLAPILIARGLAWSGQADAAGRVIDAVCVKPQPNDVLRETQMAIVAALCDVGTGRVRRARSRLDAYDRWMQYSGLEPDTMMFGPSLAVSAEVALELGDVDGAMALAHRAVEDAARVDLLGEVVWAHLVVSRCQLVAGDYGAAMRALGESRTAAVRDVTDSAMVTVIDQQRAAVHLASGDIDRAVAVIRSLPPSDARSVLWARAGLSRQPAVARRTLESLPASSPRVEAQRHALLAAIHARVSRRMAQGHLRKAAAIAFGNGLGQLLTDADPHVMALAESSALEHQDDNLLWLLSVRGNQQRNQKVVGPETPLSRGEMHLLSVLPSRSKNAEIAQSMGVSINTVKTRLRRLYAKLGANNRDEAIDIARQRGLLQ